MRALTISAHGGLDRIEFRDDVAEPRLVAPTDVRVRVLAAALNHLDLFVVEGLPGASIDGRWILGSDAVGIVEEVGKDVTTVRVGDRVILNPGTSCRACEYCVADQQPLCIRYQVLGEHRPGTLAEYVVIPAVNCGVIPADTPVETAAAFPLATLTAWRMVVTRAQVRASDDVLIWGIGGGVAQAALQICKRIGAHVWVTSGDTAKLARAHALGADELLNHREVEVGRVIRERTGKRGVTVVIDNVGRATWGESLRALGRAGRLVTCGGTSGPIVETDVRRMFWNQWTLMGSTMGSESEFAAITRELAAGHLAPVVDSVFDLADGRAAFARLASGEQFGKVVVRVAA